MLSNSWKHFFTYTKDERKGIYALAVIILLLIIYNIFSDDFYRVTNDFSDFKALIAENRAKVDTTKFIKKAKKKYDKKSKYSLHLFDPNTSTKKDWLSLGLNKYQANSICKYVEKGGSFRIPSDLNKIYCLSDYEKSLLMPYVRILEADDYYDKQEQFYEKEELIREPIDLNSASIEDLIEVKGIGPATAKAIIEYKRSLGGYYSVSQLKEVYIIDSLRYASISGEFIVNEDSILPSININKDDYFKLRKHPYISKVMAYRINGYRQNKGDYKSIDQLKNIEGINDSVYERIYRYFAPLK